MKIHLNRGYKNEATKMEHSPNHYQGILGTIVSISSTLMAWISLQNAQTLAALFASCIAAISGVLAARYYWYAAKEKKINIKNKK